MYLQALVAAVAACGFGVGSDARDIKLAAWGCDPAEGVLVNLTQGAAPFDPPALDRVTVVAVHGLNPFHPLLHYTIAERYAESIGARYGSSVNVLGWDWNAGTGSGLSPLKSNRIAEEQGERLGVSLRAAGVGPERLILIGQSSGCVVVAAAARRLRWETGRNVSRTTLIDPICREHPLIFEEINIVAASDRVEHYWVQSPSGFGRPAPYAGVLNIPIRGIENWRGLLRPMHTDHLNGVRWHILAFTP